ncbi:uncharacterized protein [Elaeis guineensis]|uniref:uncharacterized protein n=1 Tax=Elaeis guineensis var. tenera TaxID=51953 RepID=UPI003C6DA76D
MEPAKVVPMGSWSSFNSTMPIEESEIMAQLLGTYHIPTEHDRHDPSFENPSISWSSDHVSDLYYCLDSANANTNSSSYYWPQGDDSSISTSGFFAPPSEFGGCYLSGSNEVCGINTSFASMDYCMEGKQLTTPSFEVAPNPTNIDPISLNDMTNKEGLVFSSTEYKFFQLVLRFFWIGNYIELHLLFILINIIQMQVHKTLKKAQSKGAEKSSKSGDEEKSNVVVNGQSSSCCSLDDDLNIFQEPNGGGSTSPSAKGSPALNLNGKSRASRGAATDPQSLHARKRRDRINERLRILQNLVPNGTKVDISTMLEEAVQYVKFLQLQIKLLSSDELWMYAPIAYNRMNIDLDFKVSP